MAKATGNFFFGGITTGKVSTVIQQAAKNPAAAQQLRMIQQSAPAPVAPKPAPAAPPVPTVFQWQWNMGSQQYDWVPADPNYKAPQYSSNPVTPPPSPTKPVSAPVTSAAAPVTDSKSTETTILSKSDTKRRSSANRTGALQLSETVQAGTVSKTLLGS